MGGGLGRRLGEGVKGAIQPLDQGGQRQLLALLGYVINPPRAVPLLVLLHLSPGLGHNLLQLPALLGDVTGHLGKGRLGHLLLLPRPLFPPLESLLQPVLQLAAQ